jgi:O-antigen ligase
LSLLFLPHLLKVSRLGWWCVFILAMTAIVLGGSRSGLASALITVTVILLLRRKFLQFSIIAGLAILVLGTAYFEGSALSQLSHGGLLRVFGLVSPDLAESTGGNDTLQWREDQWQRAWEAIKQQPLIGQGYGGVEDAFEFGAFGYNEETNTEVDLAIGGIHDGYLACALALGVPAALLFIFILGRQTFLNARRAYSLQKEDPVIAEAHCFICANIIATACGMLIGTDANAPTTWFYIAWGLFLFQLRSREQHRPKTVPALAQPTLAEQLA